MNAIVHAFKDAVADLESYIKELEDRLAQSVVTIRAKNHEITEMAGVHVRDHDHISRLLEEQRADRKRVAALEDLLEKILAQPGLYWSHVIDKALHRAEPSSAVIGVDMASGASTGRNLKVCRDCGDWRPVDGACPTCTADSMSAGCEGDSE